MDQLVESPSLHKPAYSGCWSEGQCKLVGVATERASSRKTVPPQESAWTTGRAEKKAEPKKEEEVEEDKIKSLGKSAKKLSNCRSTPSLTLFRQCSEDSQTI